MYFEDQKDGVLRSLYLFYCQVTLYVSGVSPHPSSGVHKL